MNGVKSLQEEAKGLTTNMCEINIRHGAISVIIVLSLLQREDINSRD